MEQWEMTSEYLEDYLENHTKHAEFLDWLEKVGRLCYAQYGVEWFVVALADKWQNYYDLGYPPRKALYREAAKALNL